MKEKTLKKYQFALDMDETKKKIISYIEKVRNPTVLLRLHEEIFERETITTKRIRNYLNESNNKASK